MQEPLNPGASPKAQGKPVSAEALQVPQPQPGSQSPARETISPSDVVRVLKQVAAGEISTTPSAELKRVWEFSCSLIDLPNYPKDMSAQDRSAHEVRRAQFREDVCALLRPELEGILRASPPATAPKAVFNLSDVCKKVAGILGEASQPPATQRAAIHQTDEESAREITGMLAQSIASVTISPAKVVSILKRLAKGDPEGVGSEEGGHAFRAFFTYFVEPISYADFMSPEELQTHTARRAQVRDELLAALKEELNDILLASPPATASDEARAISEGAKKLATELAVAYRSGLEPLPPHDGMSTILQEELGVRERVEECHLVATREAESAVRLALNELETRCREMNPDPTVIGVKAIERGLKNAPWGGDRLAKIGSAFFKAVRNDIMHARAEGRPELPAGLVRGCVDYLIERVSPVGAAERIAAPGGPLEELDVSLGKFKNTHEDPFYQKVKERGLERRWKSLDLDAPNPEEAPDSSARLSRLLDNEDAIQKNDAAIQDAIHVLREDALKALAVAGIVVQKGEDPLAVLKGKKAQSIFGDSPTRLEGWQEIIKEILKVEKGGYFAGDPSSVEQARKSEVIYGDREEGRRIGIENETTFIISLCSLLSTTIDRSRYPACKDSAAALNTLEQEVITAFQEGSPRPTTQFLNYALAVEHLFKDVAGRAVPEWKTSWDKKVSLEQHARNIIFTSDKTIAALQEMGVSQDDSPKIVSLVSALFDTLRNRWAHDAKKRPERAEVAELLHCAALLSTLVHLADGKRPTFTATRSHMEVRDVAQAVSLHGAVFELLSPVIAEKASVKETSGKLKDLVSSHASAAETDNDANADEIFRRDAIRNLREGILAIWDSKLLPDEGTTEGMLARAALVSTLLRWTGETSPHDPIFPLWQVYCAVRTDGARA